MTFNAYGFGGCGVGGGVEFVFLDSNALSAYNGALVSGCKDAGACGRMILGIDVCK